MQTLKLKCQLLSLAKINKMLIVQVSQGASYWRQRASARSLSNYDYCLDDFVRYQSQKWDLQKNSIIFFYSPYYAIYAPDYLSYFIFLLNQYMQDGLDLQKVLKNIVVYML